MIDKCKHGYPKEWKCGYCNQGAKNEEKESKEKSTGEMCRDGKA